MISMKKVSGLTTAVAAAAIFSAAPVVFSPASAAEANIHCYGVNVCKGHNACKTASNACKGQGSCKGLGFVAVTSKTCADIGGKVGE